MRFPIFTDEAEYLRAAQIILQNPVDIFFPLERGRQPLFIWITAFFIQFSFKDFLVSIRLVSFISGMFTMLGLYFLTFELFKRKKIATICSVIYVLYPFALVYDTIGLLDGMVGTFYIWSLYLTLRLLKKQNLTNTIFLGLVIGVGLLVKTNAIFSLYLLPIATLFFLPKKYILKFILRVTFIFFCVVIISKGIEGILKISPYYTKILDVNGIFVYPKREWIGLASAIKLETFLNNAETLISWLFGYVKVPYIFLVFISFFSWKFIRQKAICIIYFILPLLALSIFGKILFPRYIYFMTLPLLPLVALGLVYISEGLKKAFVNRYMLVVEIFVYILFLIYPLSVVLKLSIDPVNANIPKKDAVMYYGTNYMQIVLRITTNYFRAQAKEGKILIGVYKSYGWYPNAWEVYLAQEKNIIIKEYNITDEELSLPIKFISDVKKENMTAFFMSYRESWQVKKNLQELPLDLVFEQQNEKNKKYKLVVYKLKVNQ